MFNVYILKSLKDGKFYIGHTSDLAKRIKRHNVGRNKSTRCRTPFDLVYTEVYSTKGEVVSRENKIKSYKGGDEFKKLICAGGRAVNCM